MKSQERTVPASSSYTGRKRPLQQTEKQIQQSLRELDFPCTKIVIAQRISTTKTADKIIVLQNGYIEEMGTHEELMEKKGYYYELVKLQTGVDEL